MSTLTDISDAAARAVDQVGPSVVRLGRGPGRGCGVIVGDGLVATNAHNLRGAEVTVTFADGRSATGTVAGTDYDGDLAVVRVETGEATAVAWRDDPAVVGDVVFAVMRSGFGGTRVSFGIVSATERTFRGPRGRHIKGSIEHTAPAVRGSSGGPIVDADGRLVGINTNRLGEGFYLAVPADTDLRRRIDALASGQSAATPRLGIGLAPAHVARRLRASVGLEPRDGLLVRVVEDGSAAAAAGVRAGDLLVSAGGQPLTSVDDLFDAVDAAGADGTVTLGVVRGADELQIAVALRVAGGDTEQGEA
jgi:serine protease Do